MSKYNNNIMLSLIHHQVATFLPSFSSDKACRADASKVLYISLEWPDPVPHAVYALAHGNIQLLYQTQTEAKEFRQQTAATKYIHLSEVNLRADASKVLGSHLIYHWNLWI